MERIVNFGGKGHTSAIYSKNRKRIEDFSLRIPAYHLMANMPTSLGAIGTAYNYNIPPSLTLGVGSIGGSSLSGSLTPFHLLDIKVMAERQEHMEHMKLPPALYFNRNCTEEALQDLSRDKSLKKALIVTDKYMVKAGYVQRIRNALDNQGIESAVFDNVLPDPDLACVRAGVETCKSFEPDAIVAIGGGSPMDAAKFIRVMYEHPECTIQDLSARFTELRRRTHAFPEHGNLIKTLVAIPTTSGTASEVTPFSVITDDEGHKHPVFSYRMTPDIAIVDSSFTDNLPKSLVANAGLDAITHAVESYVSVVANDFTKSNSLNAIKMLFGNLEESYRSGDHDAREKVHHGSTLAGVAFANAYVGITHSLSHKVGAITHLPHGLLNAILLPHVIRYNAETKPTRQAYYPGYSHPQSLERYAEMARAIGLDGDNDNELMEKFIQAFEKLAVNMHVPTSLKDAGVREDLFFKSIDQVAIDSFDDQCTIANPRYPLVEELKAILKDAYFGGASSTSK